MPLNGLKMTILVPENRNFFRKWAPCISILRRSLKRKEFPRLLRKKTSTTFSQESNYTHPLVMIPGQPKMKRGKK